MDRRILIEKHNANSRNLEMFSLLRNCTCVVTKNVISHHIPTVHSALHFKPRVEEQTGHDDLSELGRESRLHGMSLPDSERDS